MIFRKKCNNMVNLKRIFDSHWKLLVLIFCILVFIVYIFLINPKLSLVEVSERLEQTKTIELTIKVKNGIKSSVVKKEIQNDNDTKDIISFLTSSMYISKHNRVEWNRTVRIYVESPKTYILTFLNTNGKKIIKIKFSQTHDDTLETYINGRYYDRAIKNESRLFYILENI